MGYVYEKLGDEGKNDNDDAPLFLNFGAGIEYIMAVKTTRNQSVMKWYLIYLCLYNFKSTYLPKYLLIL